MIEKIINIEGNDDILSMFGNKDENVMIIEDAFFTSIVLRNNKIQINGEDEDKCKKAESVLQKMLELSSRGELITKQLTAYLCDLASDGGISKVQKYNMDVILITSRGKQLKAKTIGQKNYVQAIEKNTVTFGIGPAGTGKTYLAVAMAVKAFKNNEHSRIILTRPAVEAGEKLGFLPGDLQNKVDPYLRPLYDALYDIMGMEAYNRNFEKGAIEIAPLAYMRGRTLDDSFIILDEAQNTTQEQLKMLLTRIGYGSKVVVTGDVTQIDLPLDKKSGLKGAYSILQGIEGIEFVYLSEKDVVRHELVKRVVKAYEEFEGKVKV